MSELPNSSPTPRSGFSSNPLYRYGIVALVVIVVLVLLGGLIMSRSRKSNLQPDQNTAASAPQPLPEEVDVTLTGNGFEPASVKIKAGGAVRWTNTSGGEATVNSDDHPNHQKFKELNLGTFVEGSTLVHIFTTPGTYTYHDHFNPEKKGTVVVE